MTHSVNRSRIAGTAGTLVILAAGLTAMPALGQSLGDMAADAAADLEQGTALFEVIFWLAGIVLIVIGVLRFRNLSEGRGTFTQAAGVVLVGAALILVPAVFNAVVESFGAGTTATIDRPTLN